MVLTRVVEGLKWVATSVALPRRSLELTAGPEQDLLLAPQAVAQRAAHPETQEPGPSSPADIETGTRSLDANKLARLQRHLKLSIAAGAGALLSGSLLLRLSQSILDTWQRGEANDASLNYAAAASTGAVVSVLAATVMGASIGVLKYKIHQASVPTEA